MTLPPIATFESTAAWTAAPYATASSALIDLHGAFSRGVDVRHARGEKETPSWPRSWANFGLF